MVSVNTLCMCVLFAGPAYLGADDGQTGRGAKAAREERGCTEDLGAGETASHHRQG